MITATITRIESTDHGTFGIFTLPNFSCFSGELSDRGNLPNISCIPKGVYKCLWTYSERFKRMMYLITSIPNRGGIRIHPANLMGDKSKGLKCQLNGCISLGFRLGKSEGQKALFLSRPAIRQLETKLNGQSFLLEIK